MLLLLLLLKGLCALCWDCDAREQTNQNKQLKHCTRAVRASARSASAKTASARAPYGRRRRTADRKPMDARVAASIDCIDALEGFLSIGGRWPPEFAGRKPVGPPESHHGSIWGVFRSLLAPVQRLQTGGRNVVSSTHPSITFDRWSMAHIPSH